MYHFAKMIVVALFFVTNPTISPAETVSRYVRQSEIKSNTVIVFVHGVLGDGQTTWLNGNSYWPFMLTSDAVFNGADIFVYSYPTSMWATLSIDELGDNLRLQLNGNGVDAYQRIIFVAHSMGGLVTRAYLLKNREAAAHTSFIYFLSTPTEGSEVASLGTLFSRNPQLGKMRPMNAEDFLADQLRQWLAAELKIPSYCAYERQDTLGLSVVKMQSASALCTKALDPINANHINIAKPANASSDVYQGFKGIYRREMALTRPSAAMIAQLQGVINALHETQIKKSEDLLPQLRDYIREPSEAKWQNVRATAKELIEQIRVAVNASMAFDAQFYEQGENVILVANGSSDIVNRQYYQVFEVPRLEWNGFRNVTRYVAQAGNRPTPQQARVWADELKRSYDRLAIELNRLLQLAQQRSRP
jgi:pimeloyl-ACP methyl ester carboxylesterase